MIPTAHLTNEQLASNVPEVLAAATAAGVQGCITVAVDEADGVAAMDCASSYAHVWHSAGIHPLSADNSRQYDWRTVIETAKSPKCVAWGELGLDRHWPDPPFDAQLRLLQEHLETIRTAQGSGIDLPVIVHCRKAVEDLLPIFADSGLPGDRFVFHCFTETPDDARKILDTGAWISLTGVVTYTNATDVADTAAFLPLDRMMVETDSPYLSPEPVRKVRPNTPAHVAYTCDFLADLRGIDRATFGEMMDANAATFFGITPPPPAPPAPASR